MIMALTINCTHISMRMKMGMKFVDVIWYALCSLALLSCTQRRTLCNELKIIIIFKICISIAIKPTDCTVFALHTMLNMMWIVYCLCLTLCSKIDMCYAQHSRFCMVKRLMKSSQSPAWYSRCTFWLRFECYFVPGNDIHIRTQTQMQFQLAHSVKEVKQKFPSNFKWFHCTHHGIQI